MIKLNLLAEKLSNCCEIDAFSISLCSENERKLLKDFLPECKTVIVLAHNVKHSLEWAWFPFEAEKNNVTCAADLHLKSECEKILSLLREKGDNSFNISYPGRSGIRFKDLANKTGLGKMGDNFLFLHRKWGAWIHLRVIITEAEIIDNLPACEDVCTHCGICKASCPAKVIKDETLLGIECGKYQDIRDIENGIGGSYIFKCEECVRACPVGNTPEKVIISKS
jgi:epoxyqueuosine reductase